MKPSQSLDELNLEEIARISEVVASESRIIVSDNFGSTTILDNDYINSIGNFKIGSPFKIRFSMLILCIGGVMELQLNLVKHTLRKGQILMVFEGTVITGINMDQDARLAIIGFDRNFADSQITSALTSRIFGRLIETPLVTLQESDISDILTVYGIIKKRLSENDFSVKNDMAWSALQMIGCIIANRLAEHQAESSDASHKQIITRHFMRLVEKYATIRRDISFYANELRISPKYLGEIIKATTGETPRKWICRQVILEAKAMLDNQQLNIQQISEALNFANQSFFGTFFRTQTGISPTAFRARNLPMQQ